MTSRRRAIFPLLDLPSDVLVRLPISLCARGMVRLSRVSRLLHSACVEAGERSVREMIEAGEADSPLPLSSLPEP